MRLRNNPVHALLVRVDSVDTDTLTPTVSATTVDDKTITLEDRSGSSHDLDEDTWYFVHPVRRDVAPVIVDEDGVWDERGESSNLDDWLLPRDNLFTPQDSQRTFGSNPSNSNIGGTHFSSQSSSVGNSVERFRSLSQQSIDSVTEDGSITDVETSSRSLSSVDSSENIGFATGGEKDFNNARDNIRKGKVPHPESISPEGLFYDYYFDVPDENPKKDALFYPSYARAETRNPVTGEYEEYLAVGLNSNMTVDDFERKPLDLSIVIDVSGSMGSGFSDYYYDNPQADSNEMTKMEATIDAVQALTEQLRDEDHLGIIIYDNSARRAKPLRPVESTDMDAIRSHISELKDGGGTDLSSGFRSGVEMLQERTEEYDESERESRVIFLTDEMPNRGQTSEDDLVDEFESAANKGIHTTFVGVGLDTNPELGSKISDVKGANHYFIHSPDEFRKRLAEEFDYMVTPLVYDLRLDLEVDGYEVIGSYGTPSTTDELLHVSTLFPSPPDESGGSKGSIMMVKLERTKPDPSVTVKASWTLRDGTEVGDMVTPDFEDIEPEYFANSSVRKAVALARYLDVLQDWTAEEYDGDSDDLDRWEHRSTPIKNPVESQEEFQSLLEELRHARDETGDSTLTREIEAVEILLE